MKTSSLFSLVAYLPYYPWFFSPTYARVWPRREHAVPMSVEVAAEGTTGNGTFDQLIDHNNPSLGTFKQQYWWSTAYWKGPGSPVFLSTVGEAAAQNFFTPYLLNASIVGTEAQAVGGALISVEHRYWGMSSPYPELNTSSLQYLTAEQAIADFVNFARTAQLPFDTSNASTAPNVPWVYFGASYAGTLGAWMAKFSPGTFWAYHATSAPLQVVYDYSNYFAPIQKGLPANCTADLSRIVAHVDSVIDSQNQSSIKEMQGMFGMEELEHPDDFAQVLVQPLYSWQSTYFFSGYSSVFQMCDTIQGTRQVDMTGNGTNAAVPNATAPGPEGAGLEKALPNYAAWVKNEFLPLQCERYGYPEWIGKMNVKCFDTYNASSPAFTDLSPQGAVNQQLGRQWSWIQCNQPMYWYQTGAPPENVSSIASRHVTAEYFQRQCDLYFGNNTYRSAGKPVQAADEINARTGGWLLSNTSRLLLVNGELDPWRSASISSDFRPGGPLESTEQLPVLVIPGATHSNDLAIAAGRVNEGLRTVQNTSVELISKWVSEFGK